MTRPSAVSDLLNMQYALYPHMTVQDMIKALYQCEFGCGHFVTDEEHAQKLILREMDSLDSLKPNSPQPPFLEPLGDFCRVHLARIKEKGLSARTLARLFRLSSAPTGRMENFHDLLREMIVLIDKGEFPLIEPERARYFLSQYRAAGCPPTHHSDEFRKMYSPAYRVILADYARYLPLLCAIDRIMSQKEHVIVAIEGGSASGKSTLGELLCRLYDCNLFHMDDFFLQTHQRTPERFEEVGGNVDYERFRTEVLDPLAKNEPFSYRVFDCSTMSLGETVDVQPKRLNVVEGAYSMHPSFPDVYDLSAFIYVDAATQKMRILERNGRTMFHRFVDEWIPLEEKYFEGTRVYEKCTFVL